MQAAFFTRGKKRNSTSHPNGIIGGTLYDVVLKNPTTITAPTLVMRFPSTATAPNYNYCYIPALGERYYYVREWRSMGVNWECDLSVDVLATYADIITGTSQTVIRATSYINKDIDNPAVITGLPETTTTTLNTNFTTDVDNGTFVLALANDDPASFGSASLYLMRREWLGAMLQKMLGTIDWAWGQQTVGSISEELLECLFNPMQYVLSCRYYPIPGGFWGVTEATATTIKFGHWALDGVPNVPMPKDAYVKNGLLTTFNAPQHPSSAEYGNWLNYPPYFTSSAYIPPFGTLAIPGWAAGQQIYCNIMVDTISGMAHLQPYIGDTFLQPLNAQLGVDVPVTQLEVDYVTAFGREMGAELLPGSGSYVSMIPGASNIGQKIIDYFDSTSGSNVGALLSGVLNTRAGAYGINAQKDMDNGAQGSLCGVFSPSYVTTKWLPVTGDIISKTGGPCYKTDVLDTFKTTDSIYTPWVQCADPHIVIDTATSDEVSAVEAYLASGVYLE